MASLCLARAPSAQAGGYWSFAYSAAGTTTRSYGSPTTWATGWRTGFTEASSTGGSQQPAQIQFGGTVNVKATYRGYGPPPPTLTILVTAQTGMSGGYNLSMNLDMPWGKGSYVGQNIAESAGIATLKLSNGVGEGNFSVNSKWTAWANGYMQTSLSLYAQPSPYMVTATTATAGPYEAVDAGTASRVVTGYSGRQVSHTYVKRVPQPVLPNWDGTATSITYDYGLAPNKVVGPFYADPLRAIQARGLMTPMGASDSFQWDEDLTDTTGATVVPVQIKYIEPPRYRLVTTGFAMNQRTYWAPVDSYEPYPGAVGTSVTHTLVADWAPPSSNSSRVTGMAKVTARLVNQAEHSQTGQWFFDWASPSGARAPRMLYRSGYQQTWSAVGAVSEVSYSERLVLADLQSQLINVTLDAAGLDTEAKPAALVIKALNGIASTISKPSQAPIQAPGIYAINAFEDIGDTDSTLPASLLVDEWKSRLPRPEDFDASVFNAHLSWRTKAIPTQIVTPGVADQYGPNGFVAQNTILSRVDAWPSAWLNSAFYYRLEYPAG